METSIEKYHRRRRVLIKNTYLAACGYALPLMTITIVKALELASYTYADVINIGILCLVSTLIFLSVIKIKRRVTRKFVNGVFYFQLLNWIVIFCYLTSCLNEVRILALFCAFIALIFLLTDTGFWSSLLLAFLAALSYGVISFYKINYGNQAGSLSTEILYVSFFFITTIFLSSAAELFARQRRDIIAAKRKAEQSVAEVKNAKVAAETANKAKSEFLANTSHELRTPLNHIIGFTEMVVDKSFGDLNEAQEEYLNDALEGSRHLLSLINDILDLSKVEAGKLELKLQEVSLRPLLENSLIMIKEKSFKHGIQITTHLDGIPETIQADERKIKQIIYNLISNAVKFTPDGGEVSLSGKLVENKSSSALEKTLPVDNLYVDKTKQTPSNGKKFVQISVEDTGIGLAQEDLNRIFDAFEQVETSKSRKYQGTGLGLSLTKRLVELHGGTIWAESEGEGKGCTFKFKIPV